MRLVGDRPVIGRTVAEALPEAAAQGYVNLLDSVFQSGTASTSFGAKYVMEAEPGGAVRERYVDVMDLARGRLGGGLPLERSAVGQLEPLLRHVVAELQRTRNRVIDIRVAVTEPVDCDRARIGQLVSNLVGNAIDHGAPDQPIQVTAATQGGWFEFSVTNAGEQIAARLLISSTPTREAPTGPIVKV